MIKLNKTPRLNLKKLTRAQIDWLILNHCRHHHSYLDHQACYFSEKPLDSPIAEKIAFLDIESSNLKASFGVVLCYAIKARGVDADKGGLITRTIVEADVKSGRYDRNILSNLMSDLKEFDRVCVYWGRDRRHDLPFLRTRALKAGINFPEYGSIYVLDLYDWAKNKLSLHSYRLETVCKEFGIPAKGHPLTGDIWLRAMAGKKDALDYITTHCAEDVICLEPVYNILEPYVRGGKVSI